jgi:ABC-2 type transport system permease protein
VRVAYAYLRRDFLVWSSYRLAAFWQVAGVLGMAVLIYFIGEAVGERSNVIPQEGGSYAAFALAGLTFFDVLFRGLGTLSAAVSEHQRAGTLEQLLLPPVKEHELLFSLCMFPFCMSLFRTVVFLTFGFAILGFWGSANVLSIVAVLVPAQLTFLGIGALSAASVLLLKQGDPIRLAYSAAMLTLGGTFVPVDAMPGWLQHIAALFPLTHALSGIREGLGGGSLVDVAPQVALLSALAVVLLPAGLLAFSWAVRRAKQEGSLVEY